MVALEKQTSSGEVQSSPVHMFFVNALPPDDHTRVFAPPFCGKGDPFSVLLLVNGTHRCYHSYCKFAFESVKGTGASSPHELHLISNDTS